MEKTFKDYCEIVTKNGVAKIVFNANSKIAHEITTIYHIDNGYLTEDIYINNDVFYSKQIKLDKKYHHLEKQLRESKNNLKSAFKFLESLFEDYENEK